MSMRQVKRVNYEKAVSPVIATILMVAITVVLSGVLYVWAANLAESNTDGSFEMYTFSANSAPGELTSETNDNLIIVTMDQGSDVNWASLSVKLSIAGAASVSCAGPGETTGACIVIESEPEGGVWEVGEAITIKENGVDMCNTATCEISVKVINERDGVTLDDSSTVAESTPLPPNPCYSKVLYNTQTHEVISKTTIDDGGHATWMLLSEANDAYTHPAYYHKQLHQVLDCSDGDTVADGNGGTWILTEPQSGGGSSGGGSSGGGSGDSGDDSPPANPDCDDSYVLYGGSANNHASYTQQDVNDGNAGDWILLDPDEWPDYNHPAYYDTSIHQVLDCTDGDSVGDWILTAPRSGGGGGGSHGGGGDSSGGDSNGGDSTPPANPSCDNSYVLYSGHPSHTDYTQQEVIDGVSTEGDSIDEWTLLDPNEHPDYNHPAYYYASGGVHDVLDCTQDDSVEGWTLVDPNSGP